jgi:hypothetical protein
MEAKEAKERQKNGAEGLIPRKRRGETKQHSAGTCHHGQKKALAGCTLLEKDRVIGDLRCG